MTTMVCAGWQAVLERRGRRQILLCGDLEVEADRDRLIQAIKAVSPIAVYSDPPWNPGNATYWRTHAHRNACESYDRFLDAWVMVALSAVRCGGAKHILTEQSVNSKHRGMFERALVRWESPLPLIGQWTVFYGSPGSASVRRPNVLLHYGVVPLTTDPEGLAGETMTIRAVAGLGTKPGQALVDPCIGKGMTSRVAHQFQLDAVGMELNPLRLQVTLDWLLRQGFQVAS